MANNILTLSGVSTQIPCDDVADCSSRSGGGVCRTTITNQYTKCSCYPGYAGENCAFTTLDLLNGQAFVQNLLQNLSHTNLQYVPTGDLQSYSAIVASLFSVRDLVLYASFQSSISAMQ